MPWCCTALEDLDDDHATAAAWTARLVVIEGGTGGSAFRFYNRQQLTRAGDVGGARAFGEQAVVADAVRAFWQHVDEEAADELVCGERHALVSIAAFDPIVLPLEGDALLVAGDQAAVGDGHAVGVARQIGEHGRRPAERPLGVDDPLSLAQRGQKGCEGLRIGERSILAEEAEAAGRVDGGECLEEQPAEQAGEHGHLSGAQASAVGYAQRRLVLEPGCRIEQPGHFLGAQHHRQRARLVNDMGMLDDIVTPERDLKKEAQWRVSERMCKQVSVSLPYRGNSHDDQHDDYT